MYRCEVCGREFDNKQAYAGHKSGYSRLGKSRIGIVREPVYCKNCGKLLNNYRMQYCSPECKSEYHAKTTKYNGIDVTLYEINNYRKEHSVCEICGRPETMKIGGTLCNLAVDHDHETNKFRGLLCYSCNTKLSWYENWKGNIEHYLNKSKTCDS